MKETVFIRQNVDKWNEYETELKKPKKDPALISKLYVQVTDDLSFAQTYYNNRSVRVYLNGIAQLLFNDINLTDKLKFKSLVNFWKIDLPVTMYKIRFELFFSFLIFSLMVGIGIITSIYEPEFARTILGDDYIDMTIENIKKDDPMAVYKQYNSFDMFLGITVNNLYVAFSTFIMGFFFGIGTFLSLMRNGIMLGTFQYFFIERDLFRESFLTIWQHGTLEISAIVIAGAAGFTIGRGLIFPGTYTRFQSLRITARRGLKVMIGLTPVFIFAAFIEGFFTRFTDAPDSLRLVSILLSLGFVIIYFVIYPVKVAKKHPEKFVIADKIGSADNTLPDLGKILPGELLFGGTLKIIKANFGKFLWFVIIASAALSFLNSIFSEYLLHSYSEGLMNVRRVFGLFINYNLNPLLFLLHSLLTSMLLLLAVSIMRKSGNIQKKDKLLKSSPKGFLLTNTFIVAFLINSLFLMPSGWNVVIAILIIPFLLFGYYVSFIENRFIFGGIKQSFGLFNNTFGEFFLHNLKFLIICALILNIANPKIYNQVLLFIKWNLWIEDIYVRYLLDFLISMLFYCSVLFSLIIMIIANNLLYHTLCEIKTGSSLINDIQQIGTRNSIRGYEFE